MSGNGARRGRRGRRLADPLAHPPDAGAYVGREPEREAESIPGGVRPNDERIAAYGSQREDAIDDAPQGGGHRDGPSADDEGIRDAGQDR